MVSEAVRELVGRRRTLEILELLETAGELNYSAIEQQVDSSSDTVADSLDLLREHSLVDRHEHHSRDVRYEITERGRECLRIIGLLEQLLFQDS